MTQIPAIHLTESQLILQQLQSHYHSLTKETMFDINCQKILIISIPSQYRYRIDNK